MNDHWFEENFCDKCEHKFLFTRSYPDRMACKIVADVHGYHLGIHYLDNGGYDYAQNRYEYAVSNGSKQVLPGIIYGINHPSSWQKSLYESFFRNCPNARYAVMEAKLEKI